MFETSKLKRLIYEKYGTQAQFAKAAGCSGATVSAYLSGETKTLAQQTIEKWADALNICAEDIKTFFFVRR